VILETAAAELRNALGVTQCQILLNPQAELNNATSGGNNKKKPPDKPISVQDRDIRQTQPPAQEIE
jgi:hypothetical protein